MTTQKITVSIPGDTLERARGAIRRGRSSSLSAYVSEALEQKINDDDLRGMLDEMLAETGGPSTNAERRRAARVLGLKPRRRRSR